MNETIKVMKNHRSIRNYLDKNVPENIIEELISAAQWAPNSVNGQQLSIIVVRDKAARSKIAELAGGQPWIARAPLFFVFVMDYYKASLAAKKNGKDLKITDSIESTIVAAIDAGLAIQNVITAAESLGLGIVPIGGVRKNPQGMIDLLKLPEFTFPINGLVIGYPADMSMQKPRMPIKAFRHEEKYNADSVKKAIEEYDESMVPYLKSVGREIEVNWSRQVMSYYDHVYYPDVFPVMKKQGFKNDR